MAVRPLRALVVGHGHMGRHHARVLRARGDLDVQVHDPGQGLAPPPGFVPDLAVVATPTSTHVQVARPLLRAGVPCLVEKPLAGSADEAEEIAHSPHLCVGHIERFNPALAPLRNCHPRFIQGERLSPPRERLAGDPAPDVDVVADLMVHDLDLSLWLTGGRAVDVRADGVGLPHAAPGSVDIAHARVEFELPAGAGRVTATLTASRVSRRPVRTLRLVEEGTYWSIDLLAKTAHFVPWGEGRLDAVEVPIPPRDALSLQAEAFIQAVRDGGAFAVTGQDALRAIHLADELRAAILAARR